MNANRPRLILATHNKHKVDELREVLAISLPELNSTDIIGAADLGIPDVIEDGVSLSQNSLIKARAVCVATGLMAIADDSGLSVEILGGAPGIFSARWAGRHGDDRANRDLLLAQLGDINTPNRKASFVCAASLVTPEGQEIVEFGEMPGVLTRSARGSGGFGYDPIFQPDGEDRTAAELSPEEKNTISHRGRAFRALAPHIASILGFS